MPADDAISAELASLAQISYFLDSLLQESPVFGEIYRLGQAKYAVFCSRAFQHMSADSYCIMSFPTNLNIKASFNVIKLERNMRGM